MTSPVPKKCGAGRASVRRRGQTAVEYLLVTVALLVVFVSLYKTLQWYLARQFSAGGVIVIKMYMENP